MRRILMLFLLPVGLLLSLHTPVQGASPFAMEEPSSSLFGFTFGYMTGSTLYHISIYDASGSGGESELEFPLNTIFVGLGGSYRSGSRNQRGNFRFDYRWLTNVGREAGKMKDSDWLTSDLDIDFPTAGAGFPNPGLDIYSESDADLRAWIIDLRMSWDSWSDAQWTIGPLVGFLYEKFSYDVSNVNQIGYGPYAPYLTGSFRGLVLRYEVTYTIPVLGVRTTFLSGPSFEAQLDLGYSPWVAAKDRDDHILRSKIATGSTTGEAFLSTVTAQWETGESNYLQLRGEYLKVHTTGTQDQVFYDGSGISFSGIHDRIDSQQAAIYVILTTRL